MKSSFDSVRIDRVKMVSLSLLIVNMPRMNVSDRVYRNYTQAHAQTRIRVSIYWRWTSSDDWRLLLLYLYNFQMNVKNFGCGFCFFLLLLFVVCCKFFRCCLSCLCVCWEQHIFTWSNGMMFSHPFNVGIWKLTASDLDEYLWQSWTLHWILWLCFPFRQSYVLCIFLVAYTAMCSMYRFSDVPTSISSWNLLNSRFNSTYSDTNYVTILLRLRNDAR